MVQKKILFLLPYPLRRAPSQRFRVELFLPYLDEANIQYKLEPFMGEGTWNILYSIEPAYKKAWGVIKGFLKRWYTVLFTLPRYSHVFIHREAAPLGPPVFEWIIAKLWRKKIIFDFDDAIWIANTSEENKLASWFKAAWKIKWISKWSHKVSAGNNYLASYAAKANADVSRVTIVPTSVDIEKRHNQLKDQDTKRVVIGWTGSHSTLFYLEQLQPALLRISQHFDIDFLVISDKPPQMNLPRLQFLPWNETTEIVDLLQMNIGLMPLHQDPWSEGKCGFKLIQYLALGIPAVASPVGVNNTILQHGTNGFLATSEDEWFTALATLIKDAALRKKMGHAGRQFIVDHYSIQAQAGRFLALFD